MIRVEYSDWLMPWCGTGS